MKKFVVLALFFVMVGCTPVEKQAYDVIVGAKAFLDTAKAQHSECPATQSTVCIQLRQATAAKDLLIDALEIYCSGPQFENGGACNPPAKGTPAADQATAKLKAAISSYNQTANDLKGII
jgi:hypothetical protein